MTSTPEAWSERVRSWSPPPGWQRVLVVDAHTEGEPVRVILDGFPDPGGRSILERRRRSAARHDDLRRALMWEPRGHADMYGCIVGPPVTPEADVGVLFTHNAGFSTMCGHGIIGVTTVLVELGLLTRRSGVGDGAGPPSTVEEGAEGAAGPDGTLPAAGGQLLVGIDTPAGFVEARAEVVDGRVRSVAFVNVPSFVSGLDRVAVVAGIGPVPYDLAYGGAFYAYVDARRFGLRLVPEELHRLVDLGRRIKAAVSATDPPVHPEAEELGFLYGTIFVGPADGDVHSRNVCVFADGEVDRSPTGTGVCGRLAIHRARGELDVGETIIVESILGTTFAGRVTAEARVGEHDAIVPEVRGRAWVTGRNEIFIDPADPLAGGFLLR